MCSSRCLVASQKLFDLLHRREKRKSWLVTTPYLHWSDSSVAIGGYLGAVRLMVCVCVSLEGKEGIKARPALLGSLSRMVLWGEDYTTTHRKT